MNNVLLFPIRRKVTFSWDSGYGSEYYVEALVEIKGEEAEVLDLFIETPRGGEPSYFVECCTTERAIEKAWQGLTPPALGEQT
jgi:hypothetical protein